jgi:hypothetical protein
VPQRLELPHLVHEHHVPQMQVRPRGVEARLDAERAPLGKALREVGLDVQVHDAALELGQLFGRAEGVRIRHGSRP